MLDFYLAEKDAHNAMNNLKILF